METKRASGLGYARRSIQALVLGIMMGKHITSTSSLHSDFKVMIQLRIMHSDILHTFERQHIFTFCLAITYRGWKAVCLNLGQQCYGKSIEANRLDFATWLKALELGEFSGL